MSHFELPEWRKLSRDEQMEIVNLPTDRSYIVSGGPGTGKSILAIHRVAKIRATNPESKVKLLVYNKPLQLHLSDALDAVELDNVYASTCHKWLWKLPAKKSGNGLWAFDWEATWRTIEKEWPNGQKPFDHVIIDEAQDIPKPLLEILHRLSKTATIFIDSRQAINAEANQWGPVNTAQITSIFLPEGHGTFYLTRNFRNTREILEVALVIQPLEDWETPERAIRSGGAKPLLENLTPAQIVNRINVYCRNNPTQRVGVPVPDNEKRDDVFEMLKLSNVPVQRYMRDSWGGPVDYDPCAEGVTVLSYNVVKGLEFDAVFIPYLEDEFFDFTDDELLRNTLYVAATRAKSYLAFFHDGPIRANWLRSVFEQCVNEGKVDRPR
jgi:DNA helicase IV